MQEEVFSLFIKDIVNFFRENNAPGNTIYGKSDGYRTLVYRRYGNF